MSTRMQTGEQLSQLIARIYDAALDPALWPEVLGEARDFIGGSAASLYSKNPTSKSLNVYYDDGRIDPHHLRLYFNRYAKLDPTTTAELFVQVEQPAATADLMPYDDFTETRLYQEWARPQGLIDLARAMLERSATSMSFFGVFREQRDGLADDETRRRLQLIAPHLRRAMLISATMEHKTAQAAAFADTLDGMSAGTYLVDANGRIVHANASGQALLDERTVLRAGGGKLAAVEAGADRQLRQSLALAGGGDAAAGVKGIAVPLPARDGEHYVAHALPLTSGERRRASADHAAVAALFVRKAALETTGPPETIARLYDLTPSELRVLLAVVDGGSVAEIAEALGVGVATVKTHLQRLFRKTGTRCQAGLLKLVTAFSNPLVS